MSKVIMEETLSDINKISSDLNESIMKETGGHDGPYNINITMNVIGGDGDSYGGDDEPNQPDNPTDEPDEPDEPNQPDTNSMNIDESRNNLSVLLKHHHEDLEHLEHEGIKCYPNEEIANRHLASDKEYYRLEISKVVKRIGELNYQSDHGSDTHPEYTRGFENGKRHIREIIDNKIIYRMSQRMKHFNRISAKIAELIMNNDHSRDSEFDTQIGNLNKKRCFQLAKLEALEYQLGNGEYIEDDYAKD